MKLKMPRAGGGPAMPKAVGGFGAWCGAHKKQLMISGVFFLFALVVCVAMNVAGNFFEDYDVGENGVNEALIALQNEVDNFRSSDEYFTHQGQIDTSDTVNIVWEGDGLDTGRWQADDGKFWDFISPSVNFASAVEYNKMREDYRQILGDCLFTVQFLAPYDVTSAALQYCKENHVDPDAEGNPPQWVMDQVSDAYTCRSSKGDFVTYPIGEDSDGNYRYMAYVYLQARNSSNKTAAVFEYTAVHTAGAGGEDNITISDFKCWPPDQSRTLKKTNNG